MRRIELPLQHYADTEYTRPAELRTESNTDFLAHALGRKPYVQYLSRTELTRVVKREFPVAASLLVTNAHQCFDGHVGMRLTPGLFMDTIVRELAREVHRNPEEYRSLFTGNPGRTRIEIRDNSLFYYEGEGPFPKWNRTIGMFREPVRNAVTPETADLFVPNFVSASEEDKLVTLLGLMDAASPFYEYIVFTDCGIPVIELDGPAGDWGTLVLHVMRLQKVFPALGEYFHGLIPVVQQIAETAFGGDVDEEFWRSFYNYFQGSGTAHVSGWINTLFAFEQTPAGPVLKSDFDWRDSYAAAPGMFPSGISAVPFTWELGNGPHAGTHSMEFVAGGFGIGQTESGTLKTDLGFAVVNAQ
jgi:hypothetical protein